MITSSIYDKYQFQDRRNHTVAGYTCMTKPQYQTLVIPVGLVVNRHTDDFEVVSDKSDENIVDDETDEHSVVSSDKFDSLFYSVGKNLGKPQPQSSCRKTRKLHRK